MNAILLLSGAVVTATWWAGAALAYWRKRWMVTAGMVLAGLTAIVFTIVSVHGHVAGWILTAASGSRVLVACLLVAGFVFNQATDRPGRWSP